eukprot:1373892-Amorphochlora_amoeboformis.AAC.1
MYACPTSLLSPFYASLVSPHPPAPLQERALDFPYRKWHVERCAGGVEVVLTGSRFDVRFRAEASGVRLVSPRIPRFDKLMPPGRLLLALKNVGSPTLGGFMHVYACM